MVGPSITGTGTAANCTCGTVWISDTGYPTGTSATSSDCPVHGYWMRMVEANTVRSEEIEKLVEAEIQAWDIVKRVWYMMLILRHYVETVARGPPHERLW